MSPFCEEAKEITEKSNFKGYIHDVGGPTGNFPWTGLQKADDQRGVPE